MRPLPSALPCLGWYGCCERRAREATSAWQSRQDRELGNLTVAPPEQSLVVAEPRNTSPEVSLNVVYAKSARIAVQVCAGETEKRREFQHTQRTCSNKTSDATSYKRA